MFRRHPKWTQCTGAHCISTSGRRSIQSPARLGPKCCERMISRKSTRPDQDDNDLDESRECGRELRQRLEINGKASIENVEVEVVEREE